VVELTHPTNTAELPGNNGAGATFPDLNHDLKLDSERTVLVHYQVSYEDPHVCTSYCYLTTVLVVDGVEQAVTRSTTGSHAYSGLNGLFGTTSGTWMGSLDAGSHKFEVHYRAGRPINLVDNFQGTRNIQVLVL